MQLEYTLLPHLMDTLPKRKPFKEKYMEEIKYWQYRNEVLLPSIIGSLLLLPIVCC